MTQKPVVGVMGASANDALTAVEQSRQANLAERLGASLAAHECVLLTGATTGLPDLVARAFRGRGGFALGVSPAENRREHLQRFGLPADGSDVIIYTGFGYKGRNVINIRSADIVVIFGGSIGTLNEFTIAYDEGKIIGVLEGTGGVADQVRELLQALRKKTQGALFFERDAAALLRMCLAELWRRSG